MWNEHVISHHIISYPAILHHIHVLSRPILPNHALSSIAGCCCVRTRALVPGYHIDYGFFTVHSAQTDSFLACPIVVFVSHIRHTAACTPPHRRSDAQTQGEATHRDERICTPLSRRTSPLALTLASPRQDSKTARLTAVHPAVSTIPIRHPIPRG